MIIELQALNYVLNKQDFSFITLNNLDESFFPEYKDEYNFIDYHYNTYGKVPDRETMIEKFKDFQFIDVKESEEYLLAKLSEAKLYGKAVKVLNEVSDLMVNGETNKAIDLLQVKMPDLSKGVSFKTVDLIEQGKQRYLDYVDRTQNRDKYFISTGFPELDKIIGGIDTKSEYGLIAARPGVGKSFVMLQVALMSAKLGYRVGIYSGEMTADKVGMRIDTLNSHISNFKISRGFSEVNDDYKKAIDDLQKIGGKLLLITPKELGGFATVSNFRTFIEKEKLDILFIDQVSLVNDLRKGQSRSDRLANISRDIKQLQTLTGIPIFAISQLNREIEKGEDPTLDNIAGSDLFGQDVTLALILQHQDGHLLIQVAKCRDGTSGKKLMYHWDVDLGLFSYIPCENDTLNKESKGKECAEVKRKYDAVDSGEPF